MNYKRIKMFSYFISLILLFSCDPTYPISIENSSQNNIQIELETNYKFNSSKKGIRGTQN